MRIIFCLLVSGIVGISAYSNGTQRDYPENELLAHPAIHITVGQQNADIVGNDNRALQAAVDYVGQLGGGIVEIEAGEYLMYDSLHLRSGVTVRGKGDETILKKCDSVRSLLAADGDYGECAITVENPDGFNIGYGVHIATKRVHGFHTICATILNKQGNYLTLSRPINADCMMVDDAYAATVFPVVSAYHIQDFCIENITIDGNRENNEKINGCRGSGIFFYQGDAGVIENCTVRNFNGDGISYQQSNDVQVLNCTVETCAGGGIHPGSGSQRTIVRGCTSQNNDADGFFFCWRVRYATVEVNRFLNNGKTGISIGHKDSDNVIERNLIEGNAGGGVHWRNETEPMAAHNITFEKNTVRNNGRYGLRIEGETNGTVIRNNNITVEDVNGIGILISKKVGGIKLEGNDIRAEEEVKDDRDIKAKYTLLNPKGNFILYVTNQSFAIDPVDIQVEIDDEVVVDDLFYVGDQHWFRSFKLSLSKGKHKIKIHSKNGEADLDKAFSIQDEDIGVIGYWYSPESDRFNFYVSKGPFLIR